MSVVRIDTSRHAQTPRADHVLASEAGRTMPRSKQSRHTNDDAIRNLQAWQDHQYDPGYRANLGRLGLFSRTGRNHTAGRLIAYALAVEFLLTIGFALATSVGVSGRAAGLVFVGASVVVLIVMLSNIAGSSSRRKRRARARS